MIRLRCRECGQSRPIEIHGPMIGDIGADVTMYIVHLMKDHPELIKKAEAMVQELSPTFDWRTRKIWI